MADDNKIVLKIQIEKGSSTVTLKNFENQVIKSGVAIKDLSNSIGNFTASKLKMNGQVKVTTDQFKRLEKSVGGFKTATGASTSATLELGRVLSDMPYGIRGVANNLQQLASNLFFMSKATDTATGKSVGFMGAIGNLFKGLIGPAGILIAFQGIIAAFDYFSNATDGAKKSTDEANVSIGVSATRLKALKDALDNGLMSRKEANEAVNAANKEFKELNLKLNENNKLTDDSVIAINSKIEALINLSKAQALQALLAALTASLASFLDITPLSKASFNALSLVALTPIDTLASSVDFFASSVALLKKSQAAIIPWKAISIPAGPINPLSRLPIAPIKPTDLPVAVSVALDIKNKLEANCCKLLATPRIP